MRDFLQLWGLLFSLTMAAMAMAILGNYIDDSRSH